MAKPRVHNEWFRTVSLGGRKSCPNCGWKLLPGQSIWSWGEYVNAKWRTIMHFCKDCYDRKVKGPLIDHTKVCGCEVTLVGYRQSLPEWLNINQPTAIRKPTPEEEASMFDVSMPGEPFPEQ